MKNKCEKQESATNTSYIMQLMFSAQFRIKTISFEDDSGAPYTVRSFPMRHSILSKCQIPPILDNWHSIESFKWVTWIRLTSPTVVCKRWCSNLKRLFETFLNPLEQSSHVDVPVPRKCQSPISKEIYHSDDQLALTLHL